MASGRLTPLVAATLPLAQAPQALALVDRGGQIGKVVVAVDCGVPPSSRA
ncbi:MAG: zinc-binding dehydrogenase [Brooklawnia sp.]